MKLDIWRAFRRGFAGVFARAFWLAVSASPACAQAVSELARSLDPDFQTVLINPANLTGELTYAADASQGGDIESAISAYERLLFYNPALSRTRFELGVLYYRLRSYEQARAYFQSALEMKDITPELRQRAQDFIAACDKRLQPDQFSGFAQSGLRYQTNASLGPGPQAVLASGRTFDSRFFARPDWNWFGAFGVNYTHDFGTQNGDTFEASIVGYDAQQFTLHQFDLGLLEIRAGPRFVFPDIGNGASIKPYVVATGGLLADAAYSLGVGGGVTAHGSIGNVAFDPYVEVVQQSYRDSALYPLASGLGGTLETYAFQASGPVVAGLSWQSRLAYAHETALYVPYGYNAFSADIWLPWNFSLPWDQRTWTLRPNGGLTDWQYKAPDPTIDPTVAQRSLEWRVGLGLDMPIVDRLYLSGLLQYRAIVSNLAVFSMRDLSVSFGPTLKF